MVGALEERKGVLDFVRAARVALDGDGTLQFFVLGDGGLREAAAALAGELGMAGRVHLLGYRPDVRAILGVSDLYVQPSHYEGLSIAMLEALAAGLPMVTTKVEGVADVFPDGRGAVAVDVGDIGGLGAGIVLLAGDAPLRETLSNRSAARVREAFTIDVIRECYRRLYAELLSTRRSRRRRRVGPSGPWPSERST